MTLTPEFSSEVTAYEVTTSNATNKVTATPTHAIADVTVELNDVEMENGTSATWDEGENEIKVTVSDGSASTVYTVAVTKETPDDQEGT